MSGLQKKLSLGFGGLLLIILAIGIQGILHLTRLGESIDVILRENYRSVVACQEMKEALERIDSGILFVLLGESDKGRELVGRNSLSFERALKVELNNITLPGEGEKAARIQQLYEQYKGSLEAIENAGTPLALRRDTYFSKSLPVFRQIKDTADEILQMNQENMNEANDNARRNAASARRQMYVLLLAGIIVATGFFFITSRWILRPINRLIKSADEIGRGNLDLVVQSDSRDEIGHLSKAFDTMASNLREFRRTGQAKLMRVQRATQQAFDSLPDAIAVIDFEGTVEVATVLARNAFGLKQNTKIQDTKFPLVMDICQRAIKSGHSVVPENGKTIIQQFVQGEERFFRPEAQPIRDQEGQPTGAVLVLKDVTQLRQQDEMKRGIISTVSHQLKTPLTSIRMAIHVLLEEKVGSLTEKQVELLLAAREDSDRLHNILNNLLDISRIESGRAAMHLQKKHPNILVLDAVDLFTLAANDRGVAIRAELRGDLPEVWADVTQIGHVFSNLLSNALRYTDPGGEIIIAAAADEACVIFEVTDTGRGIPPEYLSTVFERFFRVPDQGKETGAGLGLAIVKEIVAAHGGTVSAKSTEGRGSAFTFTLRRADRTAKEETGS
ncbi:MAG: Alginate biosynthesis sensor protein KinB [Syntrophorhabdus sp. PtaU1.Bin002]|nr:MAG: Alginate biosynthesis sensor protein KinB [Syntrophorhabdus sp. PtaU1.Bin002]